MPDTGAATRRSERLLVGGWAVAWGTTPVLVLAITGWSDEGYGAIPFGAGAAVAMPIHDGGWEPRVVKAGKLSTLRDAAEHCIAMAEGEERQAEAAIAHARLLRDRAQRFWEIRHKREKVDA